MKKIIFTLLLFFGLSVGSSFAMDYDEYGGLHYGQAYMSYSDTIKIWNYTAPNGWHIPIGFFFNNYQYSLDNVNGFPANAFSSYGLSIAQDQTSKISSSVFNESDPNPKDLEVFDVIVWFGKGKWGYYGIQDPTKHSLANLGTGLYIYGAGNNKQIICHKQVHCEIELILKTGVDDRAFWESWLGTQLVNEQFTNTMDYMWNTYDSSVYIDKVAYLNVKTGGREGNPWVKYDMSGLPIISDGGGSSSINVPTVSLSGILFDFENQYGFDSSWCTSGSWSSIVNSSTTSLAWSEKSTALWNYCKNLSLVSSGVVSVPSWSFITGTNQINSGISTDIQFTGSNGFSFSQCSFLPQGNIRGSLSNIPGLSFLKDSFLDINFLSVIDCFNTAYLIGSKENIFTFSTGYIGTSVFPDDSQSSKDNFGNSFALLLALPGVWFLFSKMR